MKFVARRVESQIQVTPRVVRRVLVTEGPVFEAVQSLREYLVANMVGTGRMAFEDGVEAMRRIRR